ncbi:MAG TPA: YppF family protein [Bacillota bacterium]|nr:YppF family protein [Bacillota bacterium]
MTLEDIVKKFIEVKQNQPSHVDELLDFIQTRYMDDELCIVNYRNLFKELHDKGARKPDYQVRELIC